MYEGLPMLEVDSNVGKITRHERHKKATEEPQPDDDASQVPPLVICPYDPHVKRLNPLTLSGAYSSACCMPLHD